MHVRVHTHTHTHTHSHNLSHISLINPHKSSPLTTCTPQLSSQTQSRCQMPIYNHLCWIWQDTKNKTFTWFNTCPTVTILFISDASTLHQQRQDSSFQLPHYCFSSDWCPFQYLMHAHAGTMTTGIYRQVTKSKVLPLVSMQLQLYTLSLITPSDVSSLITSYCTVCGN